MNRKYSNCSIEFEIERFQDIETGEIYSDQDLVVKPNIKTEYFIINLDIEGYASYDPGRTTGPFELCYPPDSDVSIEKVTDSDGNSWIDKLTSSEEELIKEELLKCLEDDEPDFDPEDYYARKRGYYD